MNVETSGPTIVVGYDGSQASRAAIALAARRARPGGRVIVVHAYDLPPNFLDAPDYSGTLGRHRARGRALLDALPLEGSDELLDVEYETELVEGSPAKAVAEAASAHDADEIVVGARGCGRFRKLLGSVSMELLHRADCPVTVIPDAAVTESGALSGRPEQARR